MKQGWFMASLVVTGALCSVGCGGDTDTKTDASVKKDTGVDAGTNPGMDATTNPGMDATTNPGMDATTNPGMDATTTNPDATVTPGCTPGTEGCTWRPGNTDQCDQGLGGISLGAGGSICFRACTTDAECAGSNRMNARCGHIGLVQFQGDPEPTEVMGCVDTANPAGGACDLLPNAQGRMIGCDLTAGLACNLNTNTCVAVPRPNCTWTTADERGACPADHPFCNPIFADTATATMAEGVCSERHLLPGDGCAPQDSTKQCDAKSHDTTCLPLDQAQTIGMCLERCRPTENWACSSAIAAQGGQLSCTQIPDLQTDGNGNPVTCTTNAQCDAAQGNTCITFGGQMVCAAAPTFGICSSACSSFPDNCAGADRGCNDLAALGLEGTSLCSYRDPPRVAVTVASSNGQGGITPPATFADCAAQGAGSCEDPALCVIFGQPGQERGMCLVGCTTDPAAPATGCAGQAGTTCQAVTGLTEGTQGICLQ
ncbi:MAG: hypothetical protein HY791_03640 [Deltaproteobacteria bacterium]|nr:hypothetical protein [Deltaproteobacteria bacterium]